MVGYCFRLNLTQRDPPVHGMEPQSNMGICLGISRTTPVNHNKPLSVVMSCSWVTRMTLHPSDWGMERPINEFLEQQCSMMIIDTSFQSSDLIRLMYPMSAHARHNNRRKWRGSISYCLTAERFSSSTFDYGGVVMQVSRK